MPRRHITPADISAVLSQTYIQPSAPTRFWKILGVNLTSRTLKLVQVRVRNGTVPLRPLSAWHSPPRPSGSPIKPTIPGNPRSGVGVAPAPSRTVTFKKFLQQYRVGP